MKTKRIVLFFFILSAFNALAQVGVNTTSPSAQLDIVSSNTATPANTDGLLIPRINAFPITNPTASQQSMLVYLTTTAGTNPPGFYYWDNTSTSWKAVGGTTGWSLTGNAGTSTATNFMGTTDNKDVIFKRNGIRAGFLGDSNTSTGSMNTAFGSNTLLSTTTGIRNTALGTNTLRANSSGNMNVTIGDQSMFSNTSGSENVAIGVGSLYSNLTGVSNVAIGRNALTSTNGTALTTEGSNNTAIGYVSMKFNSKGAYNVAIGRESLYSNTLGNNNTGIGYNAGYSNTIGNNNIFIGNQAGYNETGSNKLYIDNTTADANNALIYGDLGTTPKILRTNSQFQIGNPAASGYALPTTRGNSGQILQTDGAGNTNWVDTVNNLSIIRTNLSFNQSLNTSGWQKISFDTTVFDTKSEFSTSNNQFVALKDGFYEINAGFHTNNQSNNQYYSIGVYKNGVLYQMSAGNHSNLGVVNRNISCIVSLSAGDIIEIYAENYQSGVYIDSYSGKTYFEVKQIK